MNCPKCNAEVFEEAKFCPNCGALLLEEVHESETKTSKEQLDIAIEKPKKSKKKSAIILLACFVALLAATIIAMLFSNSAFNKAEAAEKNGDYEQALKSYSNVIFLSGEKHKIAIEKKAEIGEVIASSKAAAELIPYIETVFSEDISDVCEVRISPDKTKVGCKINGIYYIISDTRPQSAEETVGETGDVYISIQYYNQDKVYVAQYEPHDFTTIRGYLYGASDIMQRTSDNLYDLQCILYEMESNKIPSSLVQQYIKID